MGRKGYRLVAGGWWLARAILPVVVIAMLVTVPAIEHERVDRRVAALLKEDGISTRGKPIHFNLFLGGGEFLFTESVQVEFETADGQRVAPWIPAIRAGETDAEIRYLPPDGDENTVAVRYLRTDPSVARLVRDPAPRVGQWQFDIVVFTVFIGLVIPVSL